LLPNDPPDLVEPCLNQLLGIERRLAGQQLIKQHAQAVDVTPGINIQAA
jgi:hypothetical protein